MSLSRRELAVGAASLAVLGVVPLPEAAEVAVAPTLIRETFHDTLKECFHIRGAVLGDLDTRMQPERLGFEGTENCFPQHAVLYLEQADGTVTPRVAEAVKTQQITRAGPATVCKMSFTFPESEISGRIAKISAVYPDGAVASHLFEVPDAYMMLVRTTSFNIDVAYRL